MGILSKVKSRYLVNKNALWIFNIVFLCVTAFECIALAVQGSVVLSEMTRKEILPEYYIFITSMEICFVLNLLAVFLNRKYINMYISIFAIVIMLLIIVLIMFETDMLWQLCVVPLVSVILCGSNIIFQLRLSRKNNKESVVKVAKIKLDLDFQPEDMINDYKKSLKAIEDKYNMGADDREAFEKEKENLMQDMHHVLKEFVSSSDVSLIYKLETLYQAKKECIIPEDNYLLLKNQIISNKPSVEDVHYNNEKLLRDGSITETEFNHREELISSEL